MTRVSVLFPCVLVLFLVIFASGIFHSFFLIQLSVFFYLLRIYVRIEILMNKNEN